MKVDCYPCNNNLNYGIGLSSKDLVELLDLDSDGVFSEPVRTGERFWLIPHPSLTSKYFELDSGLYDGTYFAYVGGEGVSGSADLRDILALRKTMNVVVPFKNTRAIVGKAGFYFL